MKRFKVQACAEIYFSFISSILSLRLLAFSLPLCRWNPRSEHLHRKTYRPEGRTGSLDELEEFAASYRKRGNRGPEKREEERGRYEMELREFSQYPSHRDCPAQHYHSDENELEDNSDRDDHTRRNRKNKHNISPLSSPKKKRRGTWDSERPAPPPPRVSPPSSSSQEKDYDSTFLNKLLERKAKLRGVSQGKSGVRSEEDSDTPSKGSSKKSSGESTRQCSRSPSNRPEFESLPSYSETDCNRTDRPSPRPPPAHTRSSPALANSLPGRGEEPRDKSRKVVSCMKAYRVARWGLLSTTSYQKVLQNIEAVQLQLGQIGCFFCF